MPRSIQSDYKSLYLSTTALKSFSPTLRIQVIPPAPFNYRVPRAEELFPWTTSVFSKKAA